MKYSVETRFQKYVRFPYQFIVDFADPGVSVSLYTSDVRFADSGGQRLLGVGEPDDDEFLDRFLSRVTVGSSAKVSVSDSSELIMEFPELRASIAALPIDDFEGWSVDFDPPVADRISMIVCLSGGRLAEFGPPQQGRP